MFSSCAAFGSDQEEEKPGDAVGVGEEETVELNLNKFIKPKTKQKNKKMDIFEQILFKLT
jgi:hypothetical protein